MSKHQLRLQSGKKARARKDEGRVAGFLAGETPLAEALGVDDAQVQELRAQAHALYHAARWERCIDVVLALAALGDVEPFDAVIIARAYRETGDAASAAYWAELATQLLAELDHLVRHPSSREGTP